MRFSKIHAEWLPDPAKGMQLRVAVQAIESWLMADREILARFLAVSPSRLQHHAEFDLNPKEAIINIARTSRSRSIREDIVPRQGSGARVGPLYVARLTEFAERYWRPDIAADNSESLRLGMRAPEIGICRTAKYHFSYKGIPL